MKISESKDSINYINQVIRLPWDHKAKVVWDVEFSKKVLDATEYSLDTKTKIMNFINLNLENKEGVVLLIIGDKESIA
jgi:ATP-dependent Lon protease